MYVFSKFYFTVVTCYALIHTPNFKEAGLSHFMIFASFVVLFLFTAGSPTQVEYFLPVIEEPRVKRERTTNNIKSSNGTGLGYVL